MEWRSLLELFKDQPTEQSPSQPQLDLDAVTREIQIWRAFVDDPGWRLMREFLVNEANECTAKWTRGGLEARESDRLASRVQTIGWLIEIPGQRLDDVVKLLNSADEAARPDGDDLPFSCPIEPERMS